MNKETTNSICKNIGWSDAEKAVALHDNERDFVSQDTLTTSVNKILTFWIYYGNQTIMYLWKILTHPVF